MPWTDERNKVNDKERPVRNCEFCGKSLVGLGLRRDARHCSVVCRGKHGAEKQRGKKRV